MIICIMVSSTYTKDQRHYLLSIQHIQYSNHEPRYNCLAKVSSLLKLMVQLASVVVSLHPLPPNEALDCTLLSTCYINGIEN